MEPACGEDSLVWQMANPGLNNSELRTSWIETQNGRIQIPIQPVPHTPLEVNLDRTQGPFPTVQARDLGRSCSTNGIHMSDG